MAAFELNTALKATSHRWLVTGAAGFIGSHLVEQLLLAGQRVVGLDNFATGTRANLAAAVAGGGAGAGDRFTFIEGDITSLQTCHQAASGVDFVLHQAALGSVPRSLKDPLASHRSNVDGFINMLVAARDAKVRRFVFASSSSVYGDDATLPKVEARVGRVLSPYAATKHINEVYASVFERAYGLQTVGLRYFNVFGPRQDPKSAYAAAISAFADAILAGRRPKIFGDGEQTRDFVFIDNIVHANLLAASCGRRLTGEVMNIGCGGRIRLLDVLDEMGRALGVKVDPEFHPPRAGDVRHSSASIDRAKELVGYEPIVSFAAGIRELLAWEKAERAR
jgi:UDP-N-acetylglucosamine 4-epimerase